MPQPLYQIPIRFTTLLDWRLAQRLSQREAAEILGISQKRYSMLERGRMYAKGPMAKRVRDVTGVPLEVIVGAL